MTNWIWNPQWSAQDKDVPGLVLFRKVVNLSSEPHQANIKISADSRYKLYVNGQMVEMGPSRGDRQIWFYDEVDLWPYLCQGENVLAVQVLRYPLEHNKGNHGILRTEFPGLYVKGCIEDTEGQRIGLDADDTWRCRKDTGFVIVSESKGFAPLQIYEDRKGDADLAGWMFPGYQDDDWDVAQAYASLNAAVSPANLNARTIPFLYRKDRDFSQVMVVRQSVAEKDKWEKFLDGQNEITIPAGAREIVEISSGVEMTGYLHLLLVGGAGAKVALLQAESYVQDEYHRKGIPVKRRRDDWENGHLQGFTDHYQVAGYGTEERPEEYEPFWFRTFRFIRLEVETADEPLELRRFYYTETGYPLDVQTRVTTSNSDMDAIWDISERSLRRCMHETYEDCPYFEQLQYAMDSRSEILYTYAVSSDDRLARKCMDDFRRSQRYDGLLNCSYPNFGPNVIPGFSIYYIMMLYDHMMYFGDRELLEDHLPTVEKILNFYHRNLTQEGYVGKLGGANGKAKMWSFIDWTPEWDETSGVPLATYQGAITMESLLYVMGLQTTADIAEYLEREELAAICRRRAQKVQEAILTYCEDAEGILTDGPGVELYSQHVQVFAVLTHTVDQARGKEILVQTIQNPEKYAQCSVAMAFYLFRALEEAGLYEMTEGYWDIWKRMLKKGATTCVEDEVRERSECHAWGALVLYEMPSVTLGVRPASPGYASVAICPRPGTLEYASGTVVTPRGPVSVSWKMGNEGSLEYRVPEGLDVVVDDSWDVL